MKRILVLLILGLGLLVKSGVRAEGVSPNRHLVSKETVDLIQKLAQEETVINDIESQNLTKTDVGRDEELQQKWMRSTAVSEFVKAYQDKKSCQTMRQYFSRAFTLMDCFTLDNRGRVVGALYKPHDFLHDGEPDFVRCYNGGQGRIYVNQPELDAAHEAETVEISCPVQKGPRTVGVLVATVLLEKN
jgi:hypothetical protein